MEIEIYKDDINQKLTIEYISGETKEISYQEFLASFEGEVE